jgi:hypothetical protein
MQDVSLEWIHVPDALCWSCERVCDEKPEFLRPVRKRFGCEDDTPPAPAPPSPLRALAKFC